MQRYHNLDFLRAFAMMMGLAIHAPLIFWQPDFAKVFGIENIAPAEEWMNVVGGYISNWRMPLFFYYTTAPELTYFLSDPMTLYSSSEMIRKLSVIVLVNSRHLSGRVLRKNPKIASVNWLNVA